MTEKDRKMLLTETIEQLQEAVCHLQISLDRCSAIPLLSLLSKQENSLIEFEALTSRFARVVDMLIHKVYRTIDSVEFVEGGTLLDVINRAEK